MTASTKTIKISLWKHTKINPLPEGGALQHNQYKLVQQYLMLLVSCFKPFCSAELTKCCCLSSLLDCAKWRCISKWVAGANAAISYPRADGFKFGKVVQDWSQLRFHPLELKKMNLFTSLRLFFPLVILWVLAGNFCSTFWFLHAGEARKKKESESWQSTGSFTFLLLLINGISSNYKATVENNFFKSCMPWSGAYLPTALTLTLLCLIGFIVHLSHF